jgi:MFS superfamily sulfate permease-like transporter
MEILGVTLGVAGLTVVLALVFAVVLGCVFVVLRQTARQKEASARERYPQARRIDRTASFFGQQSRGATQLRGNGTLILTDTDLVFDQWVTNREFRIPLQSIQAVENPISFLGKSRFAPLLKVVYTNEQGATDAMAWQVSDLSAWMQLLNEARPQPAR